MYVMSGSAEGILPCLNCWHLDLNNQLDSWMDNSMVIIAVLMPVSRRHDRSFVRLETSE